MNDDLKEAATQLGKLLIDNNLTITTAESCTAGWVGAALASVSESSLFYSSGFITYTNHAKHRVLNVSMETLDQYTAVSEAAVREMACGAKNLSGDGIGVATSGYAGPEGGEDGTPAGTVWFAWCLPEGCVFTSRQWFSGESEQVMQKATHYCLTELTRIMTD